MKYSDKKADDIMHAITIHYTDGDEANLVVTGGAEAFGVYMGFVRHNNTHGAFEDGSFVEWVRWEDEVQTIALWHRSMDRKTILP